MASFFKWLFGTAKKERLWTEADRLLPDSFAKVKVSDAMLSQEYQNPEKKFLRSYAAAIRSGDGWDCYVCEVNLKTGDVTMNYEDFDSTLIGAVKTLVHFEERKQYQDMVKIENPTAAQTYQKLAQFHGVQFDTDGRPYMPTKESGRTSNVTLSGDAFKDMFNKNGASEVKQKSYDSWEEINKLVQVKKTVPASLKKDVNYENFVHEADTYLQRLRQLENGLKDPAYSTYDCKHKLLSLGTADEHFTRNFYDNAETYANALINGTVLKGLLDAVAGFYSDAVRNDRLLDERTLELIEYSGDAITEAARRYHDLTRQQIESIKNVVVKGEDPVKPALPLRIFLEKYKQDRIAGADRANKKGKQP